MRREGRVMQASRFRVLCADTGLGIEGVAKLLHVTPRTVRYWFSGQSSVPYAAFKLLRVMRWFELPPPFTGWCIHSGRLWSPEGHSVRPEDGTWWSLICRQAQAFRTLYERSRELDRALLRMTPDGRDALGLPPLHDVPAVADGPSADRLADRRRPGRDVPPAKGGRAAKPPGGLDLSLGHIGTRKTTAFPGEQTLTKGVEP